MAKKKKKKSDIIEMPPTAAPSYEHAGQPTKYTQELAEEICTRLSEGQLLIQIVRLPHMPTYTTVMNWVLWKEEFFEMYARARQTQADRLAEQCLEMADEAHDGESSAAQRLKVDTRKWYTAKIRPRFYGENGIGFERDKKNNSGNTLQRLVDNLRKAKRRGPGSGEDPNSSEGGT